jgi:hypothetical protein
MKKPIKTYTDPKGDFLVTVLPEYAPRPSEKTFSSKIGHTLLYAGIGNRGFRKGVSTKNNFSERKF